MPASAAVGTSIPGFDKAMEVTGLLAGRHECDGHPLMHRHPEIEVNYIATGAVEYRYGGATLTLGEGSLAVFWASVPHIATHVDDPTTQVWFHIPVRVFRQWDLPITSRVLAGKILTYETDSTDDRAILERILSDTEASRRRGDDRSRYEHVALLNMHAYLARLCLTEQESTALVEEAPTGRASAMASFVVANAADPALDVARVAASVGLHPTTAMREFRASYGVTIATYIHHHRVSWAQQLLATTDDTTSMVGFSVGFASTSSFYATFTKHAGMPPGQFRKHVQGR